MRTEHRLLDRRQYEESEYYLEHVDAQTVRLTTKPPAAYSWNIDSANP